MTSGERLDFSGLDGAAALTQLYDTHARDLHGDIVRGVDVPTADEVTVETFLVAWDRRADYRPEQERAKAWLLEIATDLIRARGYSYDGPASAEVPPMSDDVFRAGRDRLAAAQEAMFVRLPAAGATSERRVPRTPWLIGAVAMLIVAIGAVVLLRGESNDPVAEPPRQRGVIKAVGGLPAMPAHPVNAAGDLATDVPDPVLTPGQYLYVRIVTKRRVSGRPETDSVAETWWPAQVGQPTMMRYTESGKEPEVTHGMRRERSEVGLLEPTPAEAYEGLRARLGEAPDAAAQARDELLAPLLRNPFITTPERDLRLTTLGYVPDVDLRPDQRLADGTRATLLSGAKYGDEAWVDCYFDSATGHLRETRWHIESSRRLPGPGEDSTNSIARPVVVPSIGAVP
ncbi:Sigma-70 region 2 [Actinokineospora alba]|uniref:Sigma-70 region 2 n=1 Tax=Actinokineospora alba TaxID=504798 RepID=A0A1H0SSD9_9PSEU|nr:sigma factor [Actinokineospora alba]TDP66561.1 sigma-70-like protein [Actinokineospora alba]SDJ37796.1 Sigma-70 region 2 [Actinokineospora alba]SDP44623.1 Sigma-70 region 2 [Actinokineospora alba]